VSRYKLAYSVMKIELEEVKKKKKKKKRH